MRIFTCLILALFVFGCDSETTPAPTDALSLTVTGFSPARSGETYALWLAFPKAAASHGHEPQHGSTEYKLVSTFDVTIGGSLVGFDNKDLSTKLGLGLALAQHGLISIEKKDSIGSAPNVPFLVGEITGTATKGNAIMTHDHGDAIGYTFSTLGAEATLASPVTSFEDYRGELYLMNAMDESSAEVGIVGLVPLTVKWKYGLWAVDSATKSSPPFNIFYGYFSNIAEADEHPEDNRFPFPGGRYPASPSEPVYSLTTGNVTVMVTLEPNLGNIRPSVPFGAIVLQTTIPKDRQAYLPFLLTNKALNLPQATIILDR